VVTSGTTIDKKIIDIITEYAIDKVNIRSVLTCDTEG